MVNHFSVSLLGSKMSSALLLISSTVLLARLIVLGFTYEIKIGYVKYVYFEMRQLGLGSFSFLDKVDMDNSFGPIKILMAKNIISLESFL